MCTFSVFQIYLVLVVLIAVIGVQTASCFQIQTAPNVARVSCKQSERKPLFAKSGGSSPEILDAEFEKVDPRKKEKENDEAFEFNGEEMKFPEREFLKDPFSNTNSLLQIALQQNKEEFGDLDIEFFDEEMNPIECKLAFQVELNGQTYGIGVPKDPVVLISVEDSDGTTRYVDPDDDDSEELMQIMAGVLHKSWGKDLNLTRTPRFLTVQGDIQKYMANWEDGVFGSFKMVPDEMLDDSDEDLDYFYNFMREEFGEEEFNKIMNEEPQEDLGSDIMDLLPDINEDGNTKESLEELSTWFNEEAEKLVEEFNPNIRNEEAACIKLFGLEVRDGHTYSLVRPVHPVTLVGRKTDEKSELRFQLLTKEESDLLLPKLEKITLEELSRKNKKE